MGRHTEEKAIWLPLDGTAPEALVAQSVISSPERRLMRSPVKPTELSPSEGRSSASLPRGSPPAIASLSLSKSPEASRLLPRPTPNPARTGGHYPASGHASASDGHRQ